MTSDQITLAERYVLLDPIASGGMATVWRARDDVLARPIAVKVMHPQLVEDEAFVARFRREALAAARLAHPHIVATYDTGSEVSVTDRLERHYIVMEFCAGGTLASVARTEGPLDPARAAEVGATICDALAYAHRHGVIHRDIKPQNVLLTDHGTLKVADFGIAKAAFAKSDITSTGAILGTVTYLSPEQVLGQDPGPPSDLYSVGVLLYELLAGRPPFQADTQIATAMAHTRMAPTPLRDLTAAVPVGLEAVVARALEKEPAARFPSAEEMAVALRAAVSGAAPTGVLPTRGRTRPKERTAPRGSRSRRRTPLVLLLVLLALAIVGTGAWLLTRDDAVGVAGEVPGGGEAPKLEPVGARDFDPPPGSGNEHSEEVGLAIDGDPSRGWTTETYESPLQDLKPGVGLVIDLGEPRSVSGLKIRTSTPGFDAEIRVADSEGEALDAYQEVAEASDVEEQATVELPAPTTARFWLVWITRLEGDGSGSAELNEVEFFGS